MPCPLEVESIDRLMSQQVPFRWMATMISAFHELAHRDSSATTQAWRSDPFNLAMWGILQDELKIHHPESKPQSWMNRADYMPSGSRTGNCFKCGMSGHWSKDCVGRFRAGTQSHNAAMPGVQVVGDTPVFVSKQGRIFDPALPPPSPCFRCGQHHWSFQPCPAKGGGVTGGTFPMFSPSPQSIPVQPTHFPACSSSAVPPVDPADVVAAWLANQARSAGPGTSQ